MTKTRNDGDLVADEGRACGEHQVGDILAGLDLEERDITGTLEYLDEAVPLSANVPFRIAVVRRR